jgi:hypothetical protein
LATTTTTTKKAYKSEDIRQLFLDMGRADLARLYELHK